MIAPPLPPMEREVRSARLAIFSLAWAWMRFAPGDAWNLPSEGTGVVFFPAGQSSRRGWCTGTSPFLIQCMHACVSTETRSLFHSPHHHHHHHHRVLGYPKGSALELLDGTLKLRYCTTLFTKRFPTWSLPQVSFGIGKRSFSTVGHLLDIDSTVGKRVRLTKKTRPGISSHVIPDPVPGHSTPRRFASPFLRRRRERGGRASQSFSSPWGWVILHLGTPGTRRLQA